MQAKAPGLPAQPLPKARVPLAADELEAGSLVDAPRRDEHVVRPEHELAVARGPRERDALVHQARADPVPAGARFDEQQPELRDGVALSHAEDRADAFAIELRDPTPFALRVEMLDELGDDPGDERLEALVPPVLLPVARAVPTHDPAHVTGAVCPQPHLAGMHRGRIEGGLDRPHRLHDVFLTTAREPV